jgi:hypothetical protein
MEIFLGLFVILVLLSRPVPQRLLGRLARRMYDWATARYERTEELDPDETELWLAEKRRKLCSDLRRVEHLLATDSWMSATRQLGNRLAYRQLVDDLRHTPEVFPAPAPIPSFDSREISVEPLGSAGYMGAGFAARSPQVEVLEIGWRRRRN